jgi:hypothetical protein
MGYYRSTQRDARHDAKFLRPTRANPQACAREPDRVEAFATPARLVDIRAGSCARRQAQRHTSQRHSLHWQADPHGQLASAAEQPHPALAQEQAFWVVFVVSVFSVVVRVVMSVSLVAR